MCEWRILGEGTTEEERSQQDVDSERMHPRNSPFVIGSDGEWICDNCDQRNPVNRVNCTAASCHAPRMISLPPEILSEFTASLSEEGTIIDAFDNASPAHWMPARITNVDSARNRFTISFRGWGRRYDEVRSLADVCVYGVDPNCEDTISDGQRIAPFRTFSQFDQPRGGTVEGEDWPLDEAEMEARERNELITSWIEDEIIEEGEEDEEEDDEEDEEEEEEEEEDLGDTGEGERAGEGDATLGESALSIPSSNKSAMNESLAHGESEADRERNIVESLSSSTSVSDSGVPSVVSCPLGEHIANIKRSSLLAVLSHICMRLPFYARLDQESSKVYQERKWTFGLLQCIEICGRKPSTKQSETASDQWILGLAMDEFSNSSSTMYSLKKRVVFDISLSSPLPFPMSSLATSTPLFGMKESDHRSISVIQKDLNRGQEALDTMKELRQSPDFMMQKAVEVVSQLENELKKAKEANDLSGTELVALGAKQMHELQKNSVVLKRWSRRANCCGRIAKVLYRCHSSRCVSPQHNF